MSNQHSPAPACLRTRVRLGLVATTGLASVIAYVVILSRSTPETNGRPPSIDDVRPKVVLKDGYVSSLACRECHPQEYETWHKSYHRTMTQLPTQESIKSPWRGTVISLGRNYQLKQKGDEYWVEMENPEDSEHLIQRRVVLVTGSHHMQLYWYETDKSRTLGLVPISYLLEEERWVPRKSVFLGPPTEHSPPETGRWNDTCCQCHSTHPRHRRSSTDSQEWDTHVAEFGISCEACHGPGAEHVASARAKAAGLADSIVNPARLSHKRSTEICGQCHVTQMLIVRDDQRFQSHGFTFRPGQSLDESEYRRPVRLGLLATDSDLQDIHRTNPMYLQSQFWPDGMNRVTGREYNSLLESACYQHGTMSCLSCHVMHPHTRKPAEIEEWRADQLQVGMRGNQACLQCHERIAENLTAHTHHTSESTGSHCMNCHMPHTSYGLLKTIRSHQIESPSLDTSIKTGRPIACNLCHLDKTLHWTNKHLMEWYGQKSTQLPDDSQSFAASVLWMLKGDAGQRALLAWSLGWEPAQNTSGTDWMPPYLHILMDDPYDAVRQVAHRSLNRINEFKDLRLDLVLAPHKRQDAIRKSQEGWLATAPTIDRPELLFSPESGFRMDEAMRLYRPQDAPPLMLME